MRELLSDDGFNFLVDRIKRKVTTIIKTFGRSEIGGIEIEIFLKQLEKELGIGKLKFHTNNDGMLVGEIGFALINRDGNIIYNSGDLGIGKINGNPGNTIIGEIGIAQWDKDRNGKVKVLTTGDLEIGKFESKGIIGYYIEVIGGKRTLKINPETLKVEY